MTSTSIFRFNLHGKWPAVLMIKQEFNNWQLFAIMDGRQVRVYLSSPTCKYWLVASLISQSIGKLSLSLRALSEKHRLNFGKRWQDCKLTDYLKRAESSPLKTTQFKTLVPQRTRLMYHISAFDQYFTFLNFIFSFQKWVKCIPLYTSKHSITLHGHDSSSLIA